MFSSRRKRTESNKILFFNNQISNHFRPRNGIIEELSEQVNWLLNGVDIYNTNAGNVGVGFETPLVALDVSGGINSSDDFTKNYVPIAPPIGSIIAYTMSQSPGGWLICDGSLVSRSTYAALFAVIGTTFGVGNGTTTFKLPDYQGAFLRGTGTNGNYSGPDVNTSQTHATQTHSHTASSSVTDPGHEHTQSTINDDFNNSGLGYSGTIPSFPGPDSAGSITWTNINSSFSRVSVATTVADSTTAVNVNETRPYNFGVYWIIKY
jgi:microcystin-dependent protein